ncbi:uncharacterized protein EI97DRAFT_494000 [Westerdykella ornata]|uniref:DUF2293 domain-containing protein n=1 Tax=Westerdykella ornata TaxID=318751 RepID=A0A6A6JJF8_WESOR|nr:uncharacterized protein EI97DRAFT_494000 [Westerdykella ornata]KAF2276404.1 hypothetical protein EI97DRAFT_494000 [Westerdykella ornata]
MPPKHEITVTADKPMPQGYAFLPKGSQYKTLHCRKLTHEAGRRVYVVVEGKGKRVLGIRVPKSIFFQVQSLARETFASRRAATAQRDNALIRQAAMAIETQFPDIPEDEKEAVLKHGFRKYSRRVGRTGQLAMEKRVNLAVIAHIRHKHTEYDKLLGEGMVKKKARLEIRKKTQAVLHEWGAKEDFTWYFGDSESEGEEESCEGDSVCFLTVSHTNS